MVSLEPAAAHTAKLQHPHILPLFDSGSVDGLLFYVIPYVESETLRGRLHRERQLPVADATILRGVASSGVGTVTRPTVLHVDDRESGVWVMQLTPR